MVVSAVNGVKFNTHRSNITFSGESETAPKQTPKRANNFVKVPVIVMMTLSPSLLNSAGAAAENYQDGEFPQTELLAMAAPEPQSRINSATRTSSYVKPELVQYQKKFSSNGTQYTMYWVEPNKKRNPNSNYVREVYFVPNGYRPEGSGSGHDWNCPPQLSGIRFHDLGTGKEFVGAVVKEKKSNQNWYKREIKLPEEISDDLMDLVKGRTNFQVPQNGALDRMFGGANMELTTSSELLKEQYVK